MYKNYIIKPDIPKRYVYKILLVMRLTTVILIASMLQVSASSLAQKFSYVKKDVPLLQVFKELKKQTGYNILWNEKEINVTTLIDANFKKSSIEEVMDACLGQLPFSYTINDKMVLIKQKELSFRDKITSFLAAIDVRGRVLDENDAPLVGALVKVKGTKQATSTNSNGDFVLNGVDEKATLVISFLGYEAKEIAASKNVGSIKLALNTDRLEEVQINAGYYTVNDRERTGSISRVTAKEIDKNPVNNPLMALVGRVPGLQITQSNGVPGGGFTVRIRGQNSINSGNDPLYIVDGVNYPSGGISSISSGINTNLGAGGANPLALINPKDIESIEILKDADATAIYGSRGANGVILITTKRGRQGGVATSANISHGYNKVGHKVDLLNTQEYLQMRREAYFTNDKLTTTSPVYATQYDINGKYDENKYTDWQELLIGKSAPLTNASLNVSGGSSKSNYLVSANYGSEETITPGDFGMKRYGIRSNINLGNNEDRFNASLTINLSQTKSKLTNSSGSAAGILAAPNAPDAYDQYGQLNWASGTFGSNPFVDILRPVKTNNENLIANLNLSYKLLTNLTFKTSLGYNIIKRNEFRGQPLSSFDPARGATSATRQSFFGNNSNTNLIIEPQLNYDTRLANGKLSMLIGGSLQHNDSQLNVIKAANFTSDDLLENMAAAVTLTNPENTFVQYKYVALYGRLNYIYSGRYLLNLTARRDGSSRFGPGKQFSNFGAVGAGWIFSDEPFIKDKLSFLNFGKLRGSYGITGNDQIMDYRYLQLWNPSTVYAGTSTFIPDITAPNANFAWEKNQKLEFAIQLGFFKDNLSLEGAYFKNKSSNQLIFQNLPLSAGQGGAYVNLPATVQNTGWEFDTNLKLFKKQDWNWSMSFNLSLPKNKLISYDGLETSVNASKYEIGQPLNILKTYNVTVNPETGSYVIEDRNGNGTPDIADQYLIKFLGQKYFGGVQNSFKYKQFNLDILFSFSNQLGRGYLASTIQPGDFANNPASANQFSQVLNRWQKPGDITSVAKYSTTITSYSTYSNVNSLGNISIVDASYVRLRNVSLSYDLPEKLLSALKIKNAVINLQGQNLYTWTNYIGLDPETGALSIPPLRTLMIGLNVTF